MSTEDCNHPSVSDALIPSRMLASALQLIKGETDSIIWLWNLDDGQISLAPVSNLTALTMHKSWEHIFDRKDLDAFNTTIRSAMSAGSDQFEFECLASIPGFPRSKWLCSGQLDNVGGSNCSAPFMLGVFQKGRSILVKNQFGDLLPSANEANEVQTRILANMSHEIRTPLNGILGLVELALDSTPNDEVQHYLQGIRSSSIALLRVLNDILDFSKASNGFLVFEDEPFKLRSLIEDVLDLFAADAGRRGLELTCCIFPDIPDTFVGDAARIRQILLNLVGNAIKFTPRGHVTLSISASPGAGTAYVLYFSVEDSGVGIPENRIDSIFTPFVQVDSSATRRFGGTGLGLSICKTLAEGMGGKITVNSIEGKGSRFSFDIKCRRESSKTSVESRRSGLHILVSVQNAHTCSALCELLRRLGHNVEACFDSESTLSAFSRAHEANLPFDLWFVDSETASANGASLLARFNHDLGVAPRLLERCIMISSALRFSADSPLCSRFGISVRLRSPWTDSRVIACLDAALENQQALKQREEDEAITVDHHLIDAMLAPESIDIPKLLLVDDDPMNLAVLQESLSRAGFEVSTAENGSQALELFEQNVFDLIIMDIQMPVMDGISATEAIRLKEMRRSWVTSPWQRPTPILGLSADVHLAVRNAALDAGMNAVLSKPISRNQLIEAARKQIDETRQAFDFS